MADAGGMPPRVTSVAEIIAEITHQVRVGHGRVETECVAVLAGCIYRAVIYVLIPKAKQTVAPLVSNDRSSSLLRERIQVSTFRRIRVTEERHDLGDHVAVASAFFSANADVAEVGAALARAEEVRTIIIDLHHSNLELALCHAKEGSLRVCHDFA